MARLFYKIYVFTQIRKLFNIEEISRTIRSANFGVQYGHLLPFQALYTSMYDRHTRQPVWAFTLSFILICYEFVGQTTYIILNVKKYSLHLHFSF